MKTISIKLIMAMIIILSFTYCKKDNVNDKDKDVEVDLSDLFHSIAQDTYYSEDPFSDENAIIYGKWKAIAIEQSGIAGITEGPPDFDYLLIKPNGIFGILKDCELITTGKVEKSVDNNILRIKFIPETDGLGIQILSEAISINPTFYSDNEKLRLNYSNAATKLEREIE